MRINMKTYLPMLAVLLAMTLYLPGCSKDGEFAHPAADTIKTGTPKTRAEDPEPRRVLLLYSCGFSNLSRSLLDDIKDLLQGSVPEEGRENDVLLVYGHHCKSDYNYRQYTEPVLFRAYSRGGEVIRDTLKTWPAGTVSADSHHFKEVLEYVRDEFRAREYDMVFSSHASGWLPLENEDSKHIVTSVPGGPQKVIGATLMGDTQYWMDISNFADAIPDDMKMESIMMDCCLAGCVEVAYELKDKCNTIVFSPTEILIEGFDYKQLLGHLFGSTTTDPVSIARDYFAQYYPRSYATVSVVDCRKIEPLAVCCREIIANHAASIRSLGKSGIQRYYTLKEHRFLFDLRDIMAHGGASQAELDGLDRAMADCILYKGATDRFCGEGGSFDITSYSGLSCYLPSTGTTTTDNKYRTLRWNNAVRLIE